MSQKYYVRFRGRVLGPMSSEKMKDLVRRGQVTRMHELSADGMNWQKSEEFTEFYPKKAKEPAAEQVELRKERKTASATESEPKPAKSQPAEEWFVHVNNEQQGPISESKVKQWVSSGAVTQQTMIWKHGMKDWAEASVLRPDWFASTNPISTPTVNNDLTSTGSSEVAVGIVKELQRRKTWVFILSITALVLSSLQVIFMTFTFIAQIVSPAQSGGAAIVGVLFSIFFLALGILALLSFINLLQFANTLSVLHYAPTQENFLRSLKKLSTFWLYAGICVLSVLITMALFTVISFTAGIRLAYLLGN